MTKAPQDEIIEYATEVAGMMLQKFFDRLPRETREYPAAAVWHDPREDIWQLRLVCWKPEVPAPDKFKRVILLSDVCKVSTERYACQASIDAGILTIPHATIPIMSSHTAIAAELSRYILKGAVEALDIPFGCSIAPYGHEGFVISWGITLFWGEEAHGLLSISNTELESAKHPGNQNQIPFIASRCLRKWLTRSSESPGVAP
jgi:hypothetical protein